MIKHLEMLTPKAIIEENKKRTDELNAMSQKVIALTELLKAEHEQREGKKTND